MNGRSSLRGHALTRGWRALVLFALLLVGCASESGPLWADPGVIRFAPDRTHVEVEVHNVSGTARPIGEFALAGDDWGSLKFTDAALPRTVPANDSVVIRLAVSPNSFRGPDGYRSGRASLRFASDKHVFEVPIEFVGTDTRLSNAPPVWAVILGLGAIGLVAIGLPLRARLGRSSPASLGARLAVGGALAALLLLAATLPLGGGLCLGRLGVRVGAAELGQCRAGLGGHELTLLPVSPGVWWWLIALGLIAALLGAAKWSLASASATHPNQATTEIALGVVRPVGFALILAALWIGLAPAGTDALDLVLAQLRPFTLGGLALPAWGLIAQPLACVATVALAVSLPARPDADPLLVALTRLERLIWAALITTTLIGGFTVPYLSDRPIPPLTHAGMLAVEVIVFALEIAAVAYGLRRLGELLEHRAVSTAALLRAHARWTIPLAFANLIAVTLWRL